MLESVKTAKRLNARLYTFVAKVITPVVLVAGLLVLALVHFNGVLKITTAQDNLYRGVTSFNVGAMQASFQQDAGTDRPAIYYGSLSLLTYVDWSSRISIDGNVQNLWDNYHGYSVDTNNRQVFSTTSGYGWQVVQVVTLVNDHTVTVHYDFVSRNQGNAEPHQVALTIFHSHRTWYQPTERNNVFTAGVLAPDAPGLNSGIVPVPSGTLRVAVNGPAVLQDAIAITDIRSMVGANGASQSFATTFTTTYQLQNPLVDKLTPMGTETITFSSAPAGVGSPTPAAGNTP